MTDSAHNSTMGSFDSPCSSPAVSIRGYGKEEEEENDEGERFEEIHPEMCAGLPSMDMMTAGSSNHNTTMMKNSYSDQFIQAIQQQQSTSSSVGAGSTAKTRKPPGRQMSTKEKSAYIKALLQAWELAIVPASELSTTTDSSLSGTVEGHNNKNNSNNKEQLLALMRQFAISHGGLIRDEYRAKIWPKLIRSRYEKNFGGFHDDDEDDDSDDGEGEDETVTIGIGSDSGHEDESPSTPNGDVHHDDDPLATPSVSNQDLKEHKDYEQVEMDVMRTLTRFPPNLNETERHDLQRRLTPLIMRLLYSNHTYSYYQGFHDILLTLLMVSEKERDTLRMAAQLCQLDTFPFLTQPVDVINSTLDLIYVIVWQTDPDLERFMRRAGVGTTFSLSWIITWFAHAIDDYKQVVRLYDFFIASHPLMSVYVAAAIVLCKSQQIQEECDCDMAEIHSFLLKSPGRVPLEAIISDSQDLFVEYPPSKLENQLRGSYHATAALEAEAEKTGGLRRSVSWHVGVNIVPKHPHHPARGMRPSGGAVVSASFLAVTATAAAWYLYSHSSIWHHFIH